MGAFLAVLSEYRLIISAIISSLILGLIIWKNFDSIRFWWFNFKYGLPAIGTLSRLSKDYKSIEKTGWRSSEKRLCDDYLVYYNRFVGKNADYYDNCKSYLGKVDERDRSPFPWYMWLLVVALVFVEAMGFSYVLAGWTIPGASENMQQLGAVGIAFLISVILVGFTHYAGHELYQNSLVEKVKTWWRNDPSSNKPTTLTPYGHIISLEHNHLDDDAPHYIQMLNRIKTNANVTKNWTITIITVLVIAVVAAGATYVRGQVLEKQLTMEVSGQSDNVYGDVPQALSDTQKTADTKAKEDVQSAERKGGWGTFIVLAFIFVFLQLMGILFGYKWGFAGKESFQAWKDSHEFPTRDAFVNFFNRKRKDIEKVAQGRLTTLQQKLQQEAMSRGISIADINNGSNRSFLDYVEQASLESYQHEIKQANAAQRAEEAHDAMKIAKPEIKKTEQDSTLECSKCHSSVAKGAKFCPSCGANLSELLITDPTCPKCMTKYPDGTKFCTNDGEPLVSGELVKPKCIKCGTVYTDGTKFCPQDGGEVKVAI
jgi:RNA polymerase subunit RPABC4/transcription elongation factor Spt4